MSVVQARRNQLFRKRPPHQAGISHGTRGPSAALAELGLQGLPDYLFFLDREGRILDYFAAETTWIPRDGFIGKEMAGIFPATVGRLFRRAIRHTRETGQIATLQYDLETPDGLRSFRARTLKLSALQIAVVGQDITPPGIAGMPGPDIRLTSEAIRERLAQPADKVQAGLAAAIVTTQNGLIPLDEVTITALSHALGLRDRETEGHAVRVTDMTIQLARRMGLPETDLDSIRQGALLHDIGKMGIPDAILLKPNPLTPREWQVMKQHPQLAFEILSGMSHVTHALEIPLYHHEKWDGTGYPNGLSGNQIPLAARIFAVVDVYDALTSDRPYRRAWPRGRALEYIHSQSGTHFDPRAAEAFLEWAQELN